MNPARALFISLFLFILSFYGIPAWGEEEVFFEIEQDEEIALPDADSERGMVIWRYMPFHEKSLLAQPATKPRLRIAANHPRLNGATAALPIYGAAAQALYVNMENGVVFCDGTPAAYLFLIYGNLDVFFGLGPSKAQQKAAAAEGLTLTRLPIAREAFVFLTHKDNPVENLSLEQIRAIYSRRITNWREVGGSDEKILAFQRPADSGSQTIMEEVVMQGTALAKPIEGEHFEGMGDIVRGVADYRNRLNAIGYSFRWYASTLFPSLNIKFLAVNGVAPTVENIQNGTYPLTVNFEAVAARKQSKETKALLTWLTSPEGQDLIRRTGYVPLK
jgi:phosphate transport system substrate-binding protein